MKRLIVGIMAVALIFLSTGCDSDDGSPGKGVSIQPARATWNTGYFQEVLARKALEALGYKVKPVKELQNSLFYKSLTLGDVDYWTNGWFPMHWAQVPKDFKEKAGIYGTVIPAGGLQGYLISKSYADKFNIKSLDDFKRPEVKKAFDTNGDGKADLVACPPGWGCEKVIKHHFKVYKLKDHINPSQAAYAANMADTLAKFKKGQPVFFYTWAPNWTIFKLKPGKDVVWINVPEINPTPSQKITEERMTQSGVEGAVSDPIKLGFTVADIQIAANKKFMDNNPAIKKFFSLFTVPLSDINEQNTKMKDGENSAEDIDRHAEEWIAKNKATWDGWLEAARAAAN